MAEEIKAAVTAAEPFKREPYKGGGGKGEKPVVLVQDISDLHIGEIVRPEETESFGGYNWKIAQQRMFWIAEKLLGYVALHRLAYKINELHLFLKGDYVSGDIHRELSVTNEFPVPVQTANAGLLLGEFVTRLAPHFEKIVLVEVGADNHGRLTAKPQAKQKAANSFSYLVHAVCNAYLRNHGNLEIVQAEGMKYLHDCKGQSFLIEHGDTVRGWAGVPYYGMERVRAREAVRRMQSEVGFDYWSIGHFHCPAVISGNILVNGSLSGTSEFDHSQGRHAAPSQVCYLVHPRWGVFNWTPWRVGQA